VRTPRLLQRQLSIRSPKPHIIFLGCCTNDPVINRSVHPLCIAGNPMNTHKKCQPDWIDLHVRATSVLRDSICIGIMWPSFLIYNRTSASLLYIIYLYTDLIQVIFSLGIDSTMRILRCTTVISASNHM
jgi:hypothetical protein